MTVIRRRFALRAEEGAVALVRGHGSGHTNVRVLLTRGRRVHRVRPVDATPRMIEFGMMLETRARTSSATSASVRRSETLRVPVASGCAGEADSVVRRFSEGA